jgi:20S proteasome subunit beta 6
MAAMFSQNPVMNGPNYSFSDAPKQSNGEFREHRFNPYAKHFVEMNTADP